MNKKLLIIGGGVLLAMCVALWYSDGDIAPWTQKFIIQTTRNKSELGGDHEGGGSAGGGGGIPNPGGGGGNPTGYGNSNNTGNNNMGKFFDFTLRKVFKENKGGIFFYRIIVRNDGNIISPNATVVDYLNQNAQLMYKSVGGVYNGNTNSVVRNIPSLKPGESYNLDIQIKGMGAYMNRAEICGYAETSNYNDPDSNPCSMGYSGTPFEDDESIAYGSELPGGTGGV